MTRPPRFEKRIENSFPRTPTLPPDSPLYWVVNKDRFLRQLLIRDIEEITGRPLLVYYSNRHFQAEINDDDVWGLTELTCRLEKTLNDEDNLATGFDLLLETTGGETDATESLVKLLRNTGYKFRVIVANAAKSNGTLICLAASEIVMGPSSELGPIEPHIAGIPTSTLADVQYEKSDDKRLRFWHKDALWAIKQTKKLAYEFLKSGMMNECDDETIKSCVDKLSTRQFYPTHGAAIDLNCAKELGLKIKSMTHSDPVFSRIWMLKLMYAHDTRLNNLQKIFEDRQVSASVEAHPEAVKAAKGGGMALNG
jgi:Serine dehydrogenase proteinase